MENIFNKYIKISQAQFKVFWGTFLAMFIIVALQIAGVRPPKIVFPFSRQDVLQKIIPQLDNKTNNYKLEKKQSFVKPVFAGGPFENAPSYLLADFQTGEVLAEKNMGQKLPIASLTKIMTAVVALDLASVNDVFTVSQKASQIEPTRMGLRTGQKLTLGELLNGLLLTSANDAAEVVREGINQKYKADVFVKAMNEKAAFLGLQNTHFANPQGFDDPRNYSSASDLAILSHYALENYPQIASLSAKDYVFLPATNTHTQFDLYNWNGLLGVYPGTKGLKIGNTEAAGYTTIVLSNRGGHKLLAILLGAPGILQRDLWTSSLLDLGYEKIAGLRPIALTINQMEDKYGTWKYWN